METGSLSRLDSHIRRVQAQRDCLNAAVAMMSAVPGAVFELGLGNGRTYDHLRELLPDREIFVFERNPMTRADSMPDGDHLVVGDVFEMLPAMYTRFAGRVALLHNDLGIGDDEGDAALADRLAPHIAMLMAPGGIVITQQPMVHEVLAEWPMPVTVPSERYFMYRRLPVEQVHPAAVEESDAASRIDA
jgi:hypothetical protein